MLKKEGATDTGHSITEGSFNGEKVQYIARRVIVKLAPPDGEMELQQALDSILKIADGATILRPPGKTGRMVLLVPEGEDVARIATRLSGSNLVAYAEPDVVDRAQIVPNDVKYSNQWSPGKVNAEAAWDLETGDSNVVIGIIDSGISISGSSPDHPDLSTSGRFVLGTDFVDAGTPRDMNGHGTHVAGIAAGAGNNSVGIAGMNWNSPVYICRTLDAGGNGSSADFADAVEEITDFAVASNKKAVINYSAGGASNQTKQDAAQYASDHGMLLVAATGNDYGGPVIYPAAYSTTITGVVAVGSTDQNDTVSNFSNVGPEVTVVAPGSGIYSTTPTYAVTLPVALNYDTLDGTSMATPLVTGLAALMWSRHPSHTNQKIKQCLQDTAVKLGAGTFNNSWGYGRVDALAALKCGDLVVVPSKLVTCKSWISLCKSTLAACPSQLIVCTSNIVNCKTKIFISCLPKTAICPVSYLGKCPTKFPYLCPITKISNCWSNLICVEPKTKMAICGDLKTMICKSAVDACPSAPGGCPFDPGIITEDPIIKRIQALEQELEELKRERWYQAEGGSQESGGWFYVDDDGEIHEA